MDTVLGNRVKVGSVYTIYTKHTQPTSQTLDYDANNILPLLEETEKSALMFNPEPW